MKIVLLLSSLGSGGAERVACTLCNSWVTHANSVTIVSTFSGVSKIFYTFSDGVQVVSLNDTLNNYSVSGKRYLKRLFGLRKLIRDQQPDVVISFLPNVNIAALLATAFSGHPCIICERSDPSAQPIGWFWRLACQVLYRFSDAVCVQTQAVSISIRNVYSGLKRVAVVSNPLPPDLHKWEANQPKSGRKSMLSLGRLAPEKRVDLIIDSFANLVNKHLDWDLHIYGEGPLAESLSLQIANLSLQERIFLHCATDQPWKTMADSDAFVMASRYEGFPNALLEAMGIGLACVSTDCPSGPREISRNGKDALLVEVDDRVGLELALNRLMSDDVLRRTLGMQARESVSERYSLSNVLKSWDEIFASLGVNS
jgi:GalNAc-alpha-(1->4)-GalNAc-alpha-(1->3)-diNAcBac-PP-undecaprenol alpha-1,4-N-acetyl-D-galactosaminyltransferase